MLIEELEIVEAGRHKKITIKADVPVVGILGPNASGKSTILTMLKFAFDGDLPNTQDSWVRNFGMEGAANNGHVLVRFRKHGMQGVIFRQFGKTPKRYLEWNGEKLTKQADMEKMLTDILGADRKALSKAIFVPQGDMDKLFYGNTAEREQLFTRLLLLSHLEKVENILDGKMKSMSKSLVDLDALTNEIAEQREGVETDLAMLHKQFTQSRDWAPDLALLQKRNQAVSAANHASSQVEYYKGQMTDVATRFQAMLAQPLQDRSFSKESDLTEWLSAQRQLLESQQASLSALNKQKQLVQRIEGLDAAFARSEQQFNQLWTTIADRKDLAERPTQELQDTIAAITAWEAADKSVQQAQANMEAAGKAVAEFTANNQPEDPDKIAEAEAALEVGLAKLSELQLKHGVRQMVEGQTHTDCPVCEQPFDTSKVTPENLAALQSDIDRLKAECQTLRTLVADTRKRMMDYTQTHARLFGESGSAFTRFQTAVSACGTKPTGDKEELRKKVSEIEAAQTLQRADSARLPSLEAALKTAREERDAVTPEERKVLEVGFDTEAIQKSEAAIASFKEGIRLAEGRIENLKPLERESTKNQSLIEENIRIDAEKRKEAQDLLAQYSTELSGALDEEDPVQRIQEKIDARGQLQGRLTQAQQQADKVRARQHELDERKAEDAVKRDLMENLRKLKETFARGGLPMRFVRYKFEKLAELTRLNLAKMDADFTVDSDPAVPVSFTFTMLNEAEPYVMPQDKLSGGQKVRLSIAFLIAVQQLIIPEVAFLVLDEPSLHLDVEGKESLRDMLVNMGEQLRSSQSQIWVCDHEPLLESAFGETLKLTK